MPQKDKPKDLTPEERLFKLIQEGEKTGEKDDTLIASPESGFLKPIAFEEDTPAGGGSLPAPSLTEEEIHEKKATRAGSFRRYKTSSFTLESLQNVLSLKTLNRILGACFLLSLFYFVTSHGLVRESPGDDFMLKANAMPKATPVEVPANLFSVNVSGASVPQRNVFQPYRPPAPKPVETAAAPPDVGALQAAIANLKLTGIYMGDTPEALVETVDEQKTYAVKVGSELKNLKVKNVRPEGVLFTDGKAEQMLK